ncbi:MAG: hypothetical protein K2M17_01235, partial [Bacilli bacterium]|nr:hypothetical protein [Bacilli bacterium]
GIGNFTGKVEDITYTISPRDLSKCTTTIVLNNIDLTYTGSELKPGIASIKASFPGYELVLNSSDYLTPVYTNAQNAGTATVSITGTGNFTGTVNKTYEINPRPLTSEGMFLSVNSKNYTGQVIVFDSNDITLKYNSTPLTTSDYDVTYPTQPIINVGTHNITISGKGNYTGTLQSSFVVTALDLTNATVTFVGDDFDGDKLVYTGKDLKQKVLDGVRISIGTVRLPLGVDVTIDFADKTQRGQTDIGVKTFTIVYTSTGNVTGSKAATFEIITKDLEDSMLSVTTESVTYTGSELKLEYVLTYNEITLVRGKDYTESYANNINANSNNSAILTITGIGNFSDEIEYKFSINKADPIIKIKDLEKKLFVGDSVTNDNLTLSLSDDSTGGTITITSSIDALNPGVNVIEWKFVPDTDHANNYNEAKGKFELFAVYYVTVTFGVENNGNILAGPNAKVSVEVETVITGTKKALNKNLYKVTITLLGENEEDNRIVDNFLLGGNYEIKVELLDTKNYSLETEENIVTFYAKPTIIFSESGSFYAVCETGFEDGVKLVVDVFENDKIMSEIGAQNYAKLSNIVRVYLPRLLNRDGEELEQSEDIKLYFKPSSNDYYQLKGNNITNIAVQEQDMEILLGVYLIVADKQLNFTIYILIGLALLLLIILIIIIRILTKRKKNKQNSSAIDISKLNEQNALNANGTANVGQTNEMPYVNSGVNNQPNINGNVTPNINVTPNQVNGNGINEAKKVKPINPTEMINSIGIAKTIKANANDSKNINQTNMNNPNNINTQPQNMQNPMYNGQNMNNIQNQNINPYQNLNNGQNVNMNAMQNGQNMNDPTINAKRVNTTRRTNINPNQNNQQNINTPQNMNNWQNVNAPQSMPNAQDMPNTQNISNPNKGKRKKD